MKPDLLITSQLNQTEFHTGLKQKIGQCLISVASGVYQVA